MKILRGVVVVAFALAFVWGPILCACGGAGEIPKSPALKLNPGSYFVDSYVHHTEGACEWVQTALRRDATVNEAGQVSAPIAGVRCATDYSAGIEVDCTGFDLFTLRLRGTVDRGGYGAALAGDVTGNVLGCTRVDATVYLRRKP